MEEMEENALGLAPGNRAGRVKVSQKSLKRERLRGPEAPFPEGEVGAGSAHVFWGMEERGSWLRSGRVTIFSTRPGSVVLPKQA